MSNLSTPPSYRNGAHRPAASADLEPVALDDKLKNEMKRLSDVNNELMGRLHGDPETALEDQHEDELPRLRRENAQLRQKLAEAERLLEQAAASEENWLERQKEYEALLDEKSEVIRTLHIKVQEIQAGAASGAVSKAAENEEVKKLKAELEEQRTQLEVDEETLMQQMRQMEMAMSRDRAEMARQRNELQRMQAELNHEIENASRDPALHDRLASMQRRQQETLNRKGATDTHEPEPKKSSGFFRRLFGK
jgi:chromosome segregation ATPase